MIATALAEEGPYAYVTFEVAISATCFLIWDTIIHFSDEVEYIWQRPNSYVKWMYVFVRHVPYLVQGSILTLIASSYTGRVWSPKQCSDWIIYQVSTMQAITMAVDTILIIRIHAMYNRNKMILSTVLFLFLLECAGMVTVLALTIPKMTFTTGCIITSTPSHFVVFWILSLVFETVLFALTLFKFWGSVTCTLGKHSVVYVLFRDGIWAYAIIFVVMLLNTLMYDLVKNALAGVCFFWELAVMSFAGSHVLLNLRRLATQVHTSDPLTTYWNSPSEGELTRMEFPLRTAGPGRNIAAHGVCFELQHLERRDTVPSNEVHADSRGKT
ncbi:hypothetical protein BKA93DRAFT_343936 [Sparassis latifolia]|uniref:DUF6533 domain-containing protein n=1 Tax=Sparassis crispa TaxID=139825 RepID=A0A401H3L1_9APHY|nr:hypothetical protein SCP_1500200 [Sparassis crispa]GBE89018.1 hypothetical protein SCP_1500200 [Sparassis crispa]